MRIAQLAPNIERVPPNGYGGTELVVHLLTEELIRMGHEVTLFASGDSLTQGRLISSSDVALRGKANPDHWAAYDIVSLLKLADVQTEFDIIHNHMGWQALPFFNNLPCAVVSTNHNLIKAHCAPIYLAYKDLAYVAISQSYKRLNYPDDLNYVNVIYNGIDIAKHTYSEDNRRNYLLFIGRIGKDKGTAEAIEIANRLGLPLKIAGKIDDNDREYFNTKIKHLLCNQIEYIGEVGLTQKVELFSHAIATVYAINFDEPFGLVMAESLACGTPLLASSRGSVPEVLSDKETAVIGSTIDELVKRFPEIQNISSRACRQRAEKMFSKERMTQEYLNIYQKLTNQTNTVSVLAS